ncbi:SDR family oxidoreductase [Dyadobacter tibetensis]|uniref:SDR family oxidoreductase n=1 Tax=Dyadobacter tibetensis TaxID=1211851 RepID=UPI0004708207|nr:SDR family NAD(P)-dependent oxidoreductase [Dyadobacter tibetensis]
MKLTGNTIFITGGGSGIGRGLAESFHRLGNQVIISGRRKAKLDQVTLANPGMQSLELDVSDPASIAAVSQKLIKDYPKLNVLINNAGVMQLDDAANTIHEEMLISSMAINFAGPIRMTSALIGHLKEQDSSTVINVSSGMGFVPFGMASVYSATKAAVHSYTLTLRYQLKNSSVQVLELTPPWVRTDLLNSNNAPNAMPFDEFINEVFELLAADNEEILVERVKTFRNNPGPNEGIFVTEYNDAMLSGN